MIGNSVKWEKSFQTALTVILLIVASISVTHIFSISDNLSFSTTIIGGLGWLLLGMALLTFSCGSRRQAALIFLVFFCFGLWQGPYLEPPADTFEHLRRINDCSDSTISEIATSNRGLWHYSMATVIVNAGIDHSEPSIKLFRLHLCHAVFLGAIFTIIYLVSVKSGLADRWSFFACLVAFLFMGTGAISYFSYYSLAPTFTSLMVYWLWIGWFFFSSDWQAIWRGSLVSLVLLPVLIVNHLQEAIFLAQAVVVWLLIAAMIHISKRSRTDITQNYQKLFQYLLLGFVAGVFFLAPQSHTFREIVSDLFLHNRWQENQHLLFYLGDFFLFSKIWEYRVENTYLSTAVVMGLLSPFFFFTVSFREQLSLKLKVWLLSFLPLIGFCIPLFCFVWVSNVKYVEFYRLSYASMFWLFFAFLLQGYEKRSSR